MTDHINKATMTAEIPLTAKDYAEYYSIFGLLTISTIAIATNKDEQIQFGHMICEMKVG